MKMLFITGTGTEVGKTYVTALIAKQLLSQGVRVGVYKPVASGCAEDASDDAQLLWEAAGQPLSLDAVCPLRFSAALAPHLAARAEGKSYSAQQLLDGVEPWRDACDLLLIEGAGGLMSPLTSGDYYNADLADALGAPMVVVAANRLGVLHDTLATFLAAQQRCMVSRVAGVVLNDVGKADLSEASNAQELVARLTVPLLASISRVGAFDRPVDWFGLA